MGVDGMDAGLLEAARQLHASTPVVDLHQDTLLWARLVGYRPERAHRSSQRGLLGRARPFFGQSDLPSLRDGGVSGVGLGLVTNPLLPGLARRAVRRSLRILAELQRRSPDQLVIARCAEDIREAHRAGRVAAFAVMEGAHALGSLSELEELRAQGLGGLGLVHFVATAYGAACSSARARRQQGLTALGRELVERCAEVGLVVDLSHLSDPGALEAARCSPRPVMISHTAAAAVQPSLRNVSDEVLRAVADRGGCVGVILYPLYLAGRSRCTLQRWVQHVEHVMDVAGEDAVALGSDIDGFLPSLVDGVRHSGDLPLLTAALLGAGMHERVVRKILGLNAVRVLEAAWSGARVAAAPRAD